MTIDKRVYADGMIMWMDFAKAYMNDFCPLHDIDHKRLLLFLNTKRILIVSIKNQLAYREWAPGVFR